MFESYRFVRAPIIFALLVGIVAFLMDAKQAAELIALAFFSGQGYVYACFDHARDQINRVLAAQRGAPAAPGAAASPATYESWDNLGTLLLLGSISSFALVTGGGILRRILEWLSVHSASFMGMPFRSCYALDPILWPREYLGWRAVIAGGLIGAVVGVFASRRLVVASAEANGAHIGLRRFDREVAAVDGFATGFFAGVGMEAGLLFVDGFPLGMLDGVPVQWHPFVIPLPLFAVMLFSGLTACGGGLVRTLMIGMFLRNINPIALLKSFPWKATTQQAAGIGGVMMFVYILSGFELVLRAGESCLKNNLLLMVMLFFAAGLVGFGFWTARHRPHN